MRFFEGGVNSLKVRFHGHKAINTLRINPKVVLGVHGNLCPRVVWYVTSYVNWTVSYNIILLAVSTDRHVLASFYYASVQAFSAS